MVTYVALKCISVSIGNRMNALTFLRFTLRVIFSNIRSSVKYLIAQALMQLLIYYTTFKTANARAFK